MNLKRKQVKNFKLVILNPLPLTQLRGIKRSEERSDVAISTMGAKKKETR